MRDSTIEIRPNAVYTLAEVCQLLRISDATARRQLKSGMLRSARVGRAYRVLGSQLLEALGSGQDMASTTTQRPTTRARR